MKNRITGGKEAKELSGKGARRIVFMELKSLSIMTGMVLERESVRQVLKFSRKEGEQRVPPYLRVSGWVEVVKRPDSSAGFLNVSLICVVLANCLTSLCLVFLICEMRVIIIPTSWVFYEV